MINLIVEEILLINTMGNVWITVWKVCKLISGFKGLTARIRPSESCTVYCSFPRHVKNTFNSVNRVPYRDCESSTEMRLQSKNS